MNPAAIRLWLVKLMISSGQIGCDSVVNTARFRTVQASRKFLRQLACPCL